MSRAETYDEMEERILRNRRHGLLVFGMAVAGAALAIILRDVDERLEDAGLVKARSRYAVEELEGRVDRLERQLQARAVAGVNEGQADEVDPC